MNFQCNYNVITDSSRFIFFICLKFRLYECTCLRLIRCDAIVSTVERSLSRPKMGEDIAPIYLYFANSNFKLSALQLMVCTPEMFAKT